ncbi:PIN domain-containing protein [Haloferula sargassicola]|uniref:PIN domain-containing protein n=1 Tax=Haloferula sargassicola TaxID=490096 RepID=A0ABP9USM9_9BACT
MIALVDTNVVLDVMLGREPHLQASAGVLSAVETGRCQGLLCATTLTTIHYIAARHLGDKASLSKLGSLMSIFGVAAVNQAVIRSALTRDMPDFEDAVLHEAALQAGAQCIVTRNLDDFTKADIPVYRPEQFLAALEPPQ